MSAQSPRSIGVGHPRKRVLVTKLGLDGHDVGAKVVSMVLRDAGFEVIYLGIRQTPEAVASVAVDEDVDLIGVSVLSGAHQSLIARLIELLRESGLPDLPVVVGGMIPESDRAALEELGVRAIVDGQATSAAIVDLVSRLVNPAA